MKKIALQLLVLCLLNFSSFAQWQQSVGTTGLNMQSLLVNGMYAYAGGATGAYLSTDTAANFIFSNSGNNAAGPTRGLTHDNTYTYTCTSQGVFRSSNNGATWISKSIGLSNLLNSGIINVGTRLFVVGPGGVYMSTDNADNWTAAGLTGTDVRCITSMQDTLYVGTLNSGIYKSSDWGQNWISINNGLGSANGFRAIECKDNTVFAGGPIGTGVFRSIDFGATWTLLSSGLPSGSYRGFASNNQYIFAGSFGAGVYYSTDNGNNWTAINTGLLDLTIFDLELSTTYIIAATNTQGVFRLPLTDLNSATGIEEQRNINTVNIFPNPIQATINFIAENKMIGQDYSIYDCFGKIILFGKVDKNKMAVDASSLINGIYWVTIANTATAKFIKQ